MYTIQTNENIVVLISFFNSSDIHSIRFEMPLSITKRLHKKMNRYTKGAEQADCPTSTTCRTDRDDIEERVAKTSGGEDAIEDDVGNMAGVLGAGCKQK